jgi:hypothetical protein
MPTGRITSFKVFQSNLISSCTVIRRRLRFLLILCIVINNEAYSLHLSLAKVSQNVSSRKRDTLKHSVTSLFAFYFAEDNHHDCL